MERPLTELIRHDGGYLSLDDYEKGGGYRAIRKALKEMKPEDVTEEVKNSRLRGRGGGGFPTGHKWHFTPMGPDAPKAKYVVVNGDEMEPGTFKDRLLMEGNPHQLVEGTMVAAYAIQAEMAYIFVRSEYKLSIERLRRAIGEAYAKGYLGRNLFGSGFNLEMRVHSSAGRYICGEETALLNSLEGRRPIPRSKPPFPPVAGLWGKPTAFNNVETFCCVPHIIVNGFQWFKDLADGEDAGTKIYSASGGVNRPGAWELPMGASARVILEDRAHGLRDGRKLRGFLPGGASTGFLPAERLDVRMDFPTVEAAGSRLGTGGIIPLDDRTCPVGFVANLMKFFAQESCGWCTPCREGLPWLEDILFAMEEGSGRPGDVEILEEHTRRIRLGHTYCALAPGAMESLESALKFFRDDFEKHIRKGKCPYR